MSIEMDILRAHAQFLGKHMLSVPYPKWVRLYSWVYAYIRNYTLVVAGGGGWTKRKIKDLNLVNQSPRVLEIKLRSQLHLTTPTSAKIESRIFKNNINRSQRLPPNLPCSRLPLLPIHHLIAQFLFCNDCVAIPIRKLAGRGWFYPTCPLKSADFCLGRFGFAGVWFPDPCPNARPCISRKRTNIYPETFANTHTYMGVGQNLLWSILVGWTSINPSYFGLHIYQAFDP